MSLRHLVKISCNVTGNVSRHFDLLSHSQKDLSILGVTMAQEAQLIVVRGARIFKRKNDLICKYKHDCAD